LDVFLRMPLIVALASIFNGVHGFEKQLSRASAVMDQTSLSMWREGESESKADSIIREGAIVITPHGQQQVPNSVLDNEENLISIEDLEVALANMSSKPALTAGNIFLFPAGNEDVANSTSAMDSSTWTGVFEHPAFGRGQISINVNLKVTPPTWTMLGRTENIRVVRESGAIVRFEGLDGVTVLVVDPVASSNGTLKGRVEQSGVLDGMFELHEQAGGPPTLKPPGRPGARGGGDEVRIYGGFGG